MLLRPERRARSFFGALTLVLLTGAAAVALASCGEPAAPQAGVAPKGASGSDAGVTNGAIAYTTLNLITMMAEQPSQVDRFNAAQRAIVRQLGKPSAPALALDPGGTPDYFGSTPNWATSPPLRKFVDELPGVGPGAANGLGQFIPVAVPDTVTYPGSDYYEIAVREFSEQLHSDLPKTRLRGYVQLNRGTDAAGRNTVAPAGVHYLGPLIRARKGRPVRIKFVNQLPAGKAGKLFLPVDATVTGAGPGPDGTTPYPQNRASLHLQGGLTPWISGGSPYQWVSPSGERSPYASGPGLVPVPDMWFDAEGRPVAEGTPGATNDPGPGATTLYFTNAQSARFLYLRDDTYGITRLGVYAGEAAPYFIGDEVDDELVAGNLGKPAADRAIDREVAPGTVPAAELPLVIEDKTFVPDPDQLVTQDPTWDTPAWGGLGALWYPHVYMPNQNQADKKDLNAMGRWDYLPWFWKSYEDTVHGPVANPLYRLTPNEPKLNPGTPDVSAVPGAFFDTMLVNGTAYPYVKVQRKAYRLRILNSCPDRSLNLQLYYAQSNDVTETGPGEQPSLQTASGDVDMIPAAPPIGGGWPVGWPTDGRDGGVPEPHAAGPDMIQIGDDGGLLPQAVTLPTTPVGYYQVTKPVVGPMGGGMGRGVTREVVTIDITTRTLWLSPGERADVVVDFSQVPAGSKLILYNDAPAPSPIGDTRWDYYTGDQDLRLIGGAATTLSGYGPNTRTVMQFQVDGPAAAPFDVQRLRAALPAAYAAAQDPALVPSAEYAAVFGQEAAADAGSEDTTGTLTFTPLGRSYQLTLPVQGKMISELFDPEYGRKTPTLGVDAPLSAQGARTAIPYSAIDPATEYADVAVEAAAPSLGDGTQLWRITHDGTQEHSVSFSGLQVQVVARGRRDGNTLPADPRELGWKDTIRLDPLEWCVVALRPVVPELPFPLPSSERLYDVTRPAGAEGGFTELDPVTGATATVVNAPGAYSWEYSWSIHLPGGEESHYTRPLVFSGSPAAPTAVGATPDGQGVAVRWQASIFPPLATGFVVQRATDEGFATGVASFDAPGDATSFTDDQAPAGSTCYYRVQATGTAGASPWSAAAKVDVP